MGSNCCCIRRVSRTASPVDPDVNIRKKKYSKRKKSHTPVPVTGKWYEDGKHHKDNGPAIIMRDEADWNWDHMKKYCKDNENNIT